MEVKFSVQEVDKDICLVASPQLLAYENSDGELVVEVLFMENSGASIVDGSAKPGIGKTILEYQVDSPSGAATASIKVFKVQYAFGNSEGMPRVFEFKGAKSITKFST